MFDRFDEWNLLKKKINSGLNRPSIYHEGEIWWANIGFNIGVENNGKGNFFKRPVLVIKRINKYSCFVVPISSKIKNGDFYFQFYFRNRKHTLLLNQIKVLDLSRFINRIGQIRDNNLIIVRKAILKLFKQ